MIQINQETPNGQQCKLHTLPFEYLVLNSTTNLVLKLACIKCLGLLTQDHHIESVNSIRKEINLLREISHQSEASDKVTNNIVIELQSKLVELSKSLMSFTQRGEQMMKQSLRVADESNAALTTDPNVVVRLREQFMKVTKQRTRRRDEDEKILFGEVFPYLTRAATLISQSVKRLENPEQALTELLDSMDRNCTLQKDQIAQLKLSLMLQKTLQGNQKELRRLEYENEQLIRQKIILQEQNACLSVELKKLKQSQLGERRPSTIYFIPTVAGLEDLFSESLCFQRSLKGLPNVSSLVKILKSERVTAGSVLVCWQKGSKQPSVDAGWDELANTLVLLRVKQDIFGGLVNGSLKKNSKGLLFFLKENIVFPLKKGSKMATGLMDKQFSLSVEFGDKGLCVTIPKGRGTFSPPRIKASFETNSSQNHLGELLNGVNQFELDVFQIYSVVMG